MDQENIIKHSFFDQKNYIEDDEDRKLCYLPPENTLWIKKKDSKIDLTTMLAYINDEILIEGYLSKQSKKENKMKKHYYRLYKDRLERYDDPVTEDPNRILILRGVKCEMLNISDDEDFKNTDCTFLFIFTIDQKFCILYCQSQEQFDQWKSLLKQTCILSYFGKYYKNQKVIGRGTFAKVVLSRNLQTESQFAVKTFDKKNLLSSNTSNKARIGLINEIHLMMMLDNPNIIKLYEVYEGEYHIYLVMELLNGGELFDRIMNKGHYQEKDAAILIYKLLSSLAYLHSMNIMHRDIKPENLILKDEDGFDLKLADFGLAEFVNQKYHLFKRCGTPGYVAPEILDDEPYDTQVDIFSAGVILYILLTGSSPFYGETYNEILVKNRKCQVSYDFTDIKVDVSSVAIDLLKKMLEKDPKKRLTALECIKHKWIQSNCTLNEEDYSPSSPYKNKRQSIDQAIQQMKIDKDSNNNYINNLGNFQKMKQNLDKSNRPANLVITTPMKYKKKDEQDDEQNSPTCSPYKKKSDKTIYESAISKSNKKKGGFEIKPQKV